MAKSDGSSEERKGYIYALCNYWNLTGDRAADAGRFVDDLKTTMQTSLQIDPTDVRVELQPTGIPVYQQQQSFDVCAFKGMDIGGAKYTFEVYSRPNGSVIAAIVIALPEAMDSPQRVTERIPMMLGTFQFTKTPAVGKARSSSTRPRSAGWILKEIGANRDASIQFVGASSPVPVYRRLGAWTISLLPAPTPWHRDFTNLVFGRRRQLRRQFIVNPRCMPAVTE